MNESRQINLEDSNDEDDKFSLTENVKEKDKNSKRNEKSSATDKKINQSLVKHKTKNIMSVNKVHSSLSKKTLEKNANPVISKFDFNKDDQRRLAECFKDLTRRGVKCMLSNHNTAFINELYDGFNIKVINAKRMINANASGRGAVEEVIITNYENNSEINN